MTVLQEFGFSSCFANVLELMKNIVIGQQYFHITWQFVTAPDSLESIFFSFSKYGAFVIKVNTEAGILYIEVEAG